MNWDDKMDVTSMSDAALIEAHRERSKQLAGMEIARDWNHGPTYVGRRNVLDAIQFLDDEVLKIERELVRRMNRRERVVVAQQGPWIVRDEPILGRRG